MRWLVHLIYGVNNSEPFDASIPMAGLATQDGIRPRLAAMPDPTAFAHRLIARIRTARASSLSASAGRLVARYRSARFSRLIATSGWSGPNAFSLIASERLCTGSELR